METTFLRNKIKELFLEVLEAEISDNDFDKDITLLGIDSLDILEIFTMLRNQLNLSITRDGLMSTRSLGEFVLKVSRAN